MNKINLRYNFVPMPTYKVFNDEEAEAAFAKLKENISNLKW